MDFSHFDTQALTQHTSHPESLKKIAPRIKKIILLPLLNLVHWQVELAARKPKLAKEPNLPNALLSHCKPDKFNIK